jgi:putative oxidoreductase
MTNLGLALLRLTVAAVLIAHGAHELFGVWSGPGVGPGGLTNAAATFHAAGLEPAFILAVLGGLVHFVGGVLIALGALTRYAAAMCLVDVGIGIWKIHRRWGWFLNYTNVSGVGHGIEYVALMAGALACLILAGGGDFSIDGRRANSRAARAAGRARLRKSP